MLKQSYFPAEFFPEFKLWADIFYLSGVCEELTEEQQIEVTNGVFFDLWLESS